jgi:hypothetical protein
MERLRFDRRLSRRQGWVAPDELEQELNSLPDVADKVYVAPAEGAAPAAPDAPDAPAAPDAVDGASGSGGEVPGA